MKFGLRVHQRDGSFLLFCLLSVTLLFLHSKVFYLMKTTLFMDCGKLEFIMSDSAVSGPKLELRYFKTSIKIK